MILCGTFYGTFGLKISVWSHFVLLRWFCGLRSDAEDGNQISALVAVSGCSSMVEQQPSKLHPTFQKYSYLLTLATL